MAGDDQLPLWRVRYRLCIDHPLSASRRLIMIIIVVPPPRHPDLSGCYRYCAMSFAAGAVLRSTFNHCKIHAILEYRALKTVTKQ